MRAIFTILGLIFVGIGAVGVIIPVMPTTPFLILAAIFLAKGSKKFNDWFIGTKLYKNNLENFVKTGGMTSKEKKRILALATVMLLIALVLCPAPIGKAVIAVVIALKYYVFLFRIRTIKPQMEKVDGGDSIA